MLLLDLLYKIWSCVSLPPVPEAMHRIQKTQTLLNLTLIDARICSGLRQPLVLIVIRATPDQQGKRKAIRATWANPCTYDPNKVRYLFLTGKQPGPQSAYVNEVLQQEFDCYGDIVQYDSADGYRLLPQKQFIALSLVHHFCSNFPFVFMTDEDFLINIPKLTEYLLQVPPKGRKSFVGGHLYKDVPPRS
ncbi:beta-1,3-galactosyltransferase 1 [Paragonimus westermani]|uniref:Hexosyltransferase n=1 Tax=Paragonimus westermani TaxID=34504 RepID=A0A5J4NNA4_9TREM|nr:beta-1,3-galactosyltransferase 1 [Paragonimus westermani]